MNRRRGDNTRSTHMNTSTTNAIKAGEAFAAVADRATVMRLNLFAAAIAAIGQQVFPKGLPRAGIHGFSGNGIQD